MCVSRATEQSCCGGGSLRDRGVPARNRGAGFVEPPPPNASLAARVELTRADDVVRPLPDTAAVLPLGAHHPRHGVLLFHAQLAVVVRALPHWSPLTLTRRMRNACATQGRHSNHPPDAPHGGLHLPQRQRVCVRSRLQELGAEDGESVVPSSSLSSHLARSHLLLSSVAAPPVVVSGFAFAPRALSRKTGERHASLRDCRELAWITWNKRASSSHYSVGQRSYLRGKKTARSATCCWALTTMAR